MTGLGFSVDTVELSLVDTGVYVVLNLAITEESNTPDGTVLSCLTPSNLLSVNKIVLRPSIFRF